MKKILFPLFLVLSSSLFIFCNAQSGNINTVVGNGSAIDSGDNGLAINASLNWPEGATVDDSGNVYIIEFNESPRVRKINTSGIISTVVGNGIQGSSGDGGPATAAELNYPTDGCTDAKGNLYIADCENQVIRKVDIKTGIINKIAGIYGCGCSGGDGGPATAGGLNFPMGVFVDKTGNLYIADHTNNRIRKIDTSQIITTIAGTGRQGLSGDGGPAIAADLYYPTGVCTDTLGNVFFADTYNQRVRKVSTSTGIISTVAGSGNGYSGAGYGGDGGLATLAELHYPKSVFIDKTSNIYIADEFNNRIREVDVSGIITTIAGDGVQGFSGDGGQAVFAELNLPCAIALDTLNNIFIVDGPNMRLRKVNALATGINSINNKNSFSLYPNPSNGKFTLSLSNITDECYIEMYNILGEKMYSQCNIQHPTFNIDISSQPSGVYLYKVLKENGSLVGEGKILVSK